MTRRQGRMRMFNNEKGYGFITPDDAGTDIFLHISEFQKSRISEIKPGDRFSFEDGMGRNGKSCAVNVQRV